MPAKKKTAKAARSSKRPSRKPAVYSSNGPSYDTKMAITLIFIFLFYPLGILFMWLWMKNWPAWLKVVVTLPLIISVSVVLIIFYFFAHAVRNVEWQRQMYQREMMKNSYYNNMMNPSPTSGTNSF